MERTNRRSDLFESFFPVLLFNHDRLMWTMRSGISAGYLRLEHHRGATSTKSGQDRRRVKSISRGGFRWIAFRWFDEGLRYS